MQYYFASTCSQAVWNHVLHTDQVFYVHSVFRSGLNLILGQRLLYIGSDSTAMRPFGIMLQEPQLLSLLASCQQGNGGVYQHESKQLLWESGIVLDLSGAEKRDDTIVGKKREENWAANSLKHLNHCWEKQNPAYGLEQEFPQKHHLISSLNQLICRDSISVSQQLDFWIGRGPGLTPSGDDMLVGLMAILFWAQHFFPYEIILEYLYKKGRERTTAVSCEYLYYAAQGIFSQEVRDFLGSMITVELCEPAFYKLLALGHTSGADTILGILSGLALLLEERYEYE